MPKKKKKKTTIVPAPISPLQQLKNKFIRLKELQIELSGMKSKYQEHDALLADLLPLFIEQDADKFVITREVKLGSKKYRFNPHFFDEKKGIVVPKVWKSSAFPTGTIE